MNNTYDNTRSEITLTAIQEDPELLLQRGLECISERIGAIDLIGAHKWFNLAAFAGSNAAAAYRREISEEMTAQQIATAQRDARHMLSLS